MNTFNFEDAIADTIHVDTTGEDTKIRFDGQTLGFVPSSNGPGYSITNDWNNRHFTIGFDENSVLYHLTREDDDDRRSGKGDMKRDEFVAELYGYVRFLAHPIHEDYVDLELVGSFNVEAAREYLKEKGVIEYTDTGLTVDNSQKDDLAEELRNNPSDSGELLSKMLDPVPFDEIRESGEIIFVYPSYDRVDLIFLYPNEHVGVVEAGELSNRLAEGGGSQIMDHVFRSITSD
ncbi:hypothetical protein [Halorubrum lipolyticum]|uniref:hypothetical protein n=1 Tax=Halorubrum lipolyticum TaxID=368624 RepID=UPI0011CC5310|nr:hypothetical protein [Halorubrum lipolyticum]